MLRLRPLPDELRKGRLFADHLQQALRALQDEGMLVLEQILPALVLDLLKVRMDQDTLRLLAYCQSIGGNPRDEGQLQQGPPQEAPFVCKELVAHPLVAQILTAALGANSFCEFYNGNTNCPGSKRQRVHLDASHPDLTAQQAGPTSAIVVNVVPQDVTEHNGAIELWPGTHRIVSPNPVTNDLLESRRAKIPPIRGTLKKGDVLLRDSRLWHAGVPNLSNEIRQMIALVFVSADTPKMAPLQFSRNCESLIAQSPLRFNAEFVEGRVDYLIAPTRRIYERVLDARKKKQQAARQ